MAKFCGEIGVERRVFKVWMHNHKNTSSFKRHWSFFRFIARFSSEVFQKILPISNKFSHSGAMLQLRRNQCRLRQASSLPHPLPALWRALSPAGILPLPSPLHCQNSNQDMRVVDSTNLGCLEEGDEDDYGDCHNWVLGTCITTVLPQALTLEHGLAALKDAIMELELNPPTTSSGLIRFEVAVPPSAKAFSWFCTEPESSEVFPQFYVSKESDMATHQSTDLNNSHGIFGIGAAVDYGHLSSGDIGKLSLFRRMQRQERC